MSALPNWDGSLMHLAVAGAAAMADGGRHAARASYMWDPDDPLVFSLHIQVPLGSFTVTKERCPTPFNKHVLCSNCHEFIEWDDVGVPVADNQGDHHLWCLECADEADEVEVEESIWVVALDLLQGVCMHEAIPVEQVGSALVKIVRSSPTRITFSFTQGDNTMFLALPHETAVSFVEAVTEFTQKTPYVDDYIQCNLAQLEALANGSTPGK